MFYNEDLRLSVSAPTYGALRYQNRFRILTEHCCYSNIHTWQHYIVFITEFALHCYLVCCLINPNIREEQTSFSGEIASINLRLNCRATIRSLC